MMTKAAWDRDCQRTFWSALVERCSQISDAPTPKAEYRKASAWLDRIYNNIAMPHSAFATADNRLLLALMRAEDRAA